MSLLSPLSFIPYQFSCTDSLEDREEQRQVGGSDGYRGHSKAIFSLDMWSHCSLSHNSKIAEDNMDGFSITPMSWKVRKMNLEIP